MLGMVQNVYLEYDVKLLQCLVFTYFLDFGFF